ncbi:hypothetical protein NHP190003_00380 [Helicobacter sp. NHP19-003]|uniref:Uncharacterized protein n=1 Tax=Helicobacter gastrocanis TaxID=2849641 RepID=A0ABN6HZC0_9HELI|nr:hypothetical protein NHP190003_00380 [Helicobacter sp. NHP19-003]
MLPFLGCAANPAWVQNCPTEAYIKGGKLLACAGAPIASGDIDYAVNLASTKAKDKMAAWVLAKNPKASGQVELVGTRLESKWVGASRVYVLFSVDVAQAQATKTPNTATPKESTPKPTEPKTQEPKTPAQAIEPKKKVETKDQGAKEGAPKAVESEPKATVRPSKTEAPKPTAPTHKASAPKTDMSKEQTSPK